MCIRKWDMLFEVKHSMLLYVHNSNLQQKNSYEKSWLVTVHDLEPQVASVMLNVATYLAIDCKTFLPECATCLAIITMFSARIFIV